MRAGVAPLALTLAAASAAAGPPDTWRACEEQVARAPDALQGYRCYLEAARQGRDWDEAARRLEGLRSRDRTRPGASLFLGRVAADTGRDGVLLLYQEAARGFAGHRQVEGEILARIALAGEYAVRQRGTEAGREADRAAELAEASGRPAWIARASLAGARVAMSREQVSKAWSLAHRASGLVDEEDALDLQLELHRVLGVLQWARESPDRALAEYRSGLRLATRSGDDFEAALLRYSVAFLEVSRPGTALGSGDPLAPMREALAAARRAGNLGAELRCRLILGQGGGASARDHLARAADLANRLGDFDRGLFATRFYAYTLDPKDPASRRDILERFSRTLDRARSRGDLEHEILTQIGLSTALWAMGDRGRSLERAEAAFDAIERGRSLQRLGAIRAGWHSRFDFFYKRISGWLLQGDDGAALPLPWRTGLPSRNLAHRSLRWICWSLPTYSLPVAPGK